jgi:hypothetical protein
MEQNKLNEFIDKRIADIESCIQTRANEYGIKNIETFSDVNTFEHAFDTTNMYLEDWDNHLQDVARLSELKEIKRFIETKNK